MTGTMPRLRVALFREGRFWLAQGLEHDIGAQGEDLKDVVLRFELALECQAAVLAALPPAPVYFQQLWPHKAGLFLPDRPIAAFAIDWAIIA